MTGVVELSIRDVRNALLRVATRSDRGTGEPSTALLGSIFHQVHAGLVGNDRETNAVSFLEGLPVEKAAWKAKLVGHVYDRLLGPRLFAKRALLQGSSEGVLNLWNATRELSRWLADLIWATRERRGDDGKLVELLPECALSCEIQRPGWTSPVRLTGVADSLVRANGAFCAVELKLGQSTPAVDVGQAALYHIVASRLAGDDAGPSDSLALVRFEPTRRERIYQRTELIEAEDKLLDLVAELAGVFPAGIATGTLVAAVATATPTTNGTFQNGTVSNVAQAPGSIAPTSSAHLPPQSTPAGPSARIVTYVEPPSAAHVALGESMRAAFRAYGAQFEFEGPPSLGPRFVRFPISLRSPTLRSKLDRCREEVGLRLAVPPPLLVRIDHRLAIDVQREDPVPVLFATVRERLDIATGRDRASSSLLVGVDLAGRPRMLDLSDPAHAHVLVAGSTGSGKTEWLRMALASLAVANTPRSLRLVLVDPKQTAFGELQKSPFLRDARSFSTPSSCDEVLGLLEDLVGEMERRYRRLREVNVDDLAALAATADDAPPRIVFVCDEYFALASQAPTAERRELERLVGILGAKARASGIHLVLALQQASRAILSGAIEGNIPVRVALRTQSAIDSRMVLGERGAEDLTGKGDLLFRAASEIQRLQAPFITAAERKPIFAAEA